MQFTLSSKYRSLAVVSLLLFAASCDNSGQPDSGTSLAFLDSFDSLEEGDEWPGFSYDFASIPAFGSTAAQQVSAPALTSRNNGACTASGSNLEIAIQNFAQQCSVPRVDCDPVGGEWVCSSAAIGASSAAAVPATAVVPATIVGPEFNIADANTSSQAIDPASWGYDEVYQKPGYELVFSDEFDGYEVNQNRWNTQLRWDGEFNGSWYEYRIINGEKQFYVNTQSVDAEHQAKVVTAHNPFSFDGSRLAIRAAVNPHLESVAPTQPSQIGRGLNYGNLDPLLKRQPFLSGALSSHDKFSRKYGYFEARIKLPSHVGTFPAFWLFHQRERWQQTKRTEIDIMESLGHATRFVYTSFHYFDNVSVTYPGDANFLKPQPNGQIEGVDFSSDYHVYAVDWRPGEIIWYINGEEVSRLADQNVDNEEMYVILNLAIGGNWVNFPATAGGLGRSPDQLYPTVGEQSAGEFGNPQLEIDYVRVYRAL